MKLNFSTLLAIASFIFLLIGSLFHGEYARADETADETNNELQHGGIVQVAALPGEGLTDVLKRVQPCRIKEGASPQVMDQVLALNPEKLDAHGNFVLSQSYVKLPGSFVEGSKECSAPKEIRKKTEAKEFSVEARKPAVAELNPEAPEVETKENEEHSSLLFRVGTFLESSQLHSTNLSNGSETVLNSKPEYGVEVSAYKAISSNLFLGVNYKIAKTGFNDLDGQELRESFSSMSEVSAGVAYKMSEESVFALNFGAAQTDHLSYPDDGAIQVDAVWLPKISASLENVWVRLGRVGIGTGIGAALFLPSNQSSTEGLSEEAKLFAEYELGHYWIVGLEVEAGYQRQTFTNETHSLRSLGSSLSVGLHL